MDTKELRLEYRDPKTLQANPANWRTHPEQQRKLLDAVIREVGYAGALLYNEQTERLIDGHARLERALKCKEKQVPVLVGSWSEEDERKILATHDPIAAMAGQLDEQLKGLLEGAETENQDLSEWCDGMLKELGSIETIDSQKGGLCESTQEISGVRGLVETLVYRPTWNKIRGFSFLSLRKWSTPIRKQQIDQMRKAKEEAEPEFVTAVANEMAEAAKRLFNNLGATRYTVFSPPRSKNRKVHFAAEMARQFEHHGGQYLNVFEPQNQKINKNSQHYGDRIVPTISNMPHGLCFLIDDVATTGNTIEGCLSVLDEDCLVVPIVWIYEDSRSDDLCVME